MRPHQEPSDLSGLAAVVSDLESACGSRDATRISDGAARLFAQLRALPEPVVPGRSRQMLAGTWLLTKCAENLRELEWQLSNRWHEVEGTVRLADRCVAQMSEAL